MFVPSQGHRLLYLFGSQAYQSRTEQIRGKTVLCPSFFITGDAENRIE